MNVNEIITQKFVDKIAHDKILPWQKPWRSLDYQNLATGHKYRGLNVLTLALFGRDSFYITAKQVFSAGGKIKKGAKSLPIVFWSKIQKEEKSDTGETEDKSFYFLRYYNLFNFTDTEANDNAPDSTDYGKLELKAISLEKVIDFEPLEMAEKLVQSTGIPIKFGGSVACYRPGSHEINMPKPETFQSREHYYCTLFHELTHAMSKETSVELKAGFGSEPYAKEELVAELGANFLLSYCQIDSTGLFDNSASYLDNWTKRIANDSRLLVTAAGQAQKRFDKVLEKAGLLQTETAEAPEANKA